MARRPKTKEEIEAEKKMILDSALEIFSEHGYKKLTMREIAKKCNSSSTKIYYYFLNKDHIIVELTKIGFSKIMESINNATNDSSSNKENYIATLRCIYEFGIYSNDYYNIMFGVDTPKCMDLIKEDALNELAIEEKNVALNFYNLVNTILSDYLKELNIENDELYAISIFSKISGIIHLVDSHILREINVLHDDLFEKLISEELFNLEMKSKKGSM